PTAIQDVNRKGYTLLHCSTVVVVAVVLVVVAVVVAVAVVVVYFFKKDTLVYLRDTLVYPV
ncbi:hypothetical protein Tco_0661039, partial [Tanacetum coccineum]